jgi:hypothetical protein
MEARSPIHAGNVVQFFIVFGGFLFENWLTERFLVTSLFQDLYCFHCGGEIACMFLIKTLASGTTRTSNQADESVLNLNDFMIILNLFL